MTDMVDQYWNTTNHARAGFGHLVHVYDDWANAGKPQTVLEAHGAGWPSGPDMAEWNRAGERCGWDQGIRIGETHHEAFDRHVGEMINTFLQLDTRPDFHSVVDVVHDQQALFAQQPAVWATAQLAPIPMPADVIHAQLAAEHAMAGNVFGAVAWGIAIQLTDDPNQHANAVAFGANLGGLIGGTAQLMGLGLNHPAPAVDQAAPAAHHAPPPPPTHDPGPTGAENYAPPPTH